MDKFFYYPVNPVNSGKVEMVVMPFIDENLVDVCL